MVGLYSSGPNNGLIGADQIRVDKVLYDRVTLLKIKFMTIHLLRAGGFVIKDK